VRSPAIVVPYDNQRPERFAALRCRVDAALSAITHQTIHVGSTAVPGLAAKPIIDLDVVVPDRSLAAPAITALGAAGWRHQGDLGIPGREAFEPVPDPAYHHLYLVVADSPAHRDHLDLRDYLRTHPAERERYAALKRTRHPCWRPTVMPTSPARPTLSPICWNEPGDGSRTGKPRPSPAGTQATDRTRHSTSQTTPPQPDLNQTHTQKIQAGASYPPVTYIHVPHPEWHAGRQTVELEGNIEAVSVGLSHR
jgi:GrpB-like predicted nucleotidyltransferase (UPF0157 family)